MHGGVNAARKGVFAGQAQVTGVIEIRDAGRRIKPLDFLRGGRHKSILSFRESVGSFLESPLFPFVEYFFQFCQSFFVVHSDLLGRLMREKL